ncbi:hypothetical protein D3C87_1112810 [compost metagenome]
MVHRIKRAGKDAFRYEYSGMGATLLPDAAMHHTSAGRLEFFCNTAQNRTGSPLLNKRSGKTP